MTQLSTSLVFRLTCLIVGSNPSNTGRKHLEAFLRAMVVQWLHAPLPQLRLRVQILT